VCRPLVSTVIALDEDCRLTESLDRSRYFNSEMPQAFKPNVIANAYDKVWLNFVFIMLFIDCCATWCINKLSLWSGDNPFGKLKQQPGNKTCCYTYRNCTFSDGHRTQDTINVISTVHAYNGVLNTAVSPFIYAVLGIAKTVLKLAMLLICSQQRQQCVWVSGARGKLLSMSFVCLEF
jgi:hypothetical protein